MGLAANEIVSFPGRKVKRKLSRPFGNDKLVQPTVAAGSSPSCPVSRGFVFHLLTDMFCVEIRQCITICVTE